MLDLFPPMYNRFIVPIQAEHDVTMVFFTGSYAIDFYVSLPSVPPPIGITVGFAVSECQSHLLMLTSCIVLADFDP